MILFWIDTGGKVTVLTLCDLGHVLPKELCPFGFLGEDLIISVMPTDGGQLLKECGHRD